MMAVLDRWCRIWFEKIARQVQRKPYEDMMLRDLFQGAMMFVRYPFRRLSPGWCETVLNRGSCHLPNGRFCSSDCMGEGSLSTPCPPGLHPSLAWGFPVTGCWCESVRGRNVVCCDCTPADNSPYRRTTEDCGCMHAYD